LHPSLPPRGHAAGALQIGLPAAAGAVSVTVFSADVSPDPQDAQVLRARSALHGQEYILRPCPRSPVFPGSGSSTLREEPMIRPKRSICAAVPSGIREFPLKN
jgi:hypothetical protein